MTLGGIQLNKGQLAMTLGGIQLNKGQLEMTLGGIQLNKGQYFAINEVRLEQQIIAYSLRMNICGTRVMQVSPFI